jgi:hypothetical protein
MDSLCSRKVELKCSNEEKQVIEINNTMIASIHTSHHSVVTGPPVFIKFDKDGIAYIGSTYCR